MKLHLPISIRLTMCLVSLMISCLTLAAALGLVPDVHSTVVRGRTELCESIAINQSLMAVRGDITAMKASLTAIHKRSDGIESIGVRRASGNIAFEIGEHSAYWQPIEDGHSTETQMVVPISKGATPWGTIEVRFKPSHVSGWSGILSDPMFRLILFMSSSTALGYILFLSRSLRQLNPSNVVPTRVRTALDTLTEGLLILDAKQRIVLANSAFGKAIGRDPEKLIGRSMSDLPWCNPESQEKGKPTCAPWRDAYVSSTPITGVLLGLQISTEQRRTFLVNVTPIFSDKNRCQGVLTSLEDVTPLEQKQRELHFTLDKLRHSAEEVRQQNEVLEQLATTDSLTGCLNRRKFYEQFETHWQAAERHHRPIAAIMVDVDHFKSVNDTHGHSTGDEVLREVSAALRNTARIGDLVCRFGGEEFCVLLPNTDLVDARVAGERFRAAVAELKFAKLSVTVSVGVTAISLGANQPQELLDQADKSLYVAKRSGRNRVVAWDEVPTDMSIDKDSVTRRECPPTSTPDESSIPYRAVTALLSTLAYRHQPTAAHCRRVADLCVMLAESRMSLHDCYIIETAAHLHDIGKIGVPDAVLLKGTPLTRDESDLMRHHANIGLEIVRASFRNEKLTQIIENQQVFFGGTQNRPHLPSGLDIPLGARILAVADAFDSMTHDSVYRKAMTFKQAFTELRLCAGVQFDPELVESLIRIVTEQTSLSTTMQNETVSRDVALDCGMQIESLVTAIDDQDLERLKSLSNHLAISAQQSGNPLITQSAERLKSAIDDNKEIFSILEAACELVTLCRSTQHALLNCLPLKCPA